MSLEAKGNGGTRQLAGVSIMPSLPAGRQAQAVDNGLAQTHERRLGQPSAGWGEPPDIHLHVAELWEAYFRATDHTC